MTKVKFKRTSEWNNRARAFGLYINNEKIGTIGNGEAKEFDLAPGKHQLIAKIDWCQSQVLEFEIQKDQTKTIELAGFKYGNLIIPLFAVIFLSHFVLKIVFDVRSLYVFELAVSLFIYPLYYLTLGRKRYIRIKELE